MKSKSKKNLRSKFLKIVFSTVIIYSIVVVAGVLIYGLNRDVTNKNTTATGKKYMFSEETPKTEEEVAAEKIRTNVAVFGTDKSGFLTDVMFVASFNVETKDIDLISIPRDTQVTMTDEMIADLRSRNRGGFVPYGDGIEGTCKINEVHSYAGEGYRVEYSIAMVEELMGIEIDYYAKFSTSAFRHVVDAIGGVEFNVPIDMYYSDPVQGLYINLKAGEQVLNGNQAEQLVRYRATYSAGDLQRIQVQQDFLKATINKVLTTETIVENIVPLTETVLSYIETDITILDALGYIKYIEDVSIANVNSETIPGKATTYFYVDEEALEELVARVFYDKETEIVPEDEEVNIDV